MISKCRPGTALGRSCAGRSGRSNGDGQRGRRYAWSKQRERHSTGGTGCEKARPKKRQHGSTARAEKAREEAGKAERQAAREGEE
eukprot:7388370-Prymnesium_polylepis.1